MSTDGVQEKRKHKRITKPYTVRLRHLTPDKPGDWDMVLVKDISAGGLLFDYPHTICPGTILVFKINFGFNEPPIDCAGKTLRCNPIGPSPASFRVAAQFIEIGKKDADRIDAEAEKFFHQGQ